MKKLDDIALPPATLWDFAIGKAVTNAGLRWVVAAERQTSTMQKNSKIIKTTPISVDKRYGPRESRVSMYCKRLCRLGIGIAL